jgi:hypothetical protein
MARSIQRRRGTGQPFCFGPVEFFLFAFSEDRVSLPNIAPPHVGPDARVLGGSSDTKTKPQT